MKEQQELEVKEKLVDFAKNIRPNYRRIEISKIEYEACGHLQLLALAKQSQYLQDRDCSEDSYKFQQFERDCNEIKGWIGGPVVVVPVPPIIIHFLKINLLHSPPVNSGENIDCVWSLLSQT